MIRMAGGTALGELAGRRTGAQAARPQRNWDALVIALRAQVLRLAELPEPQRSRLSGGSGADAFSTGQRVMTGSSPCLVGTKSWVNRN